MVFLPVIFISVFDYDTAISNLINYCDITDRKSTRETIKKRKESSCVLVNDVLQKGKKNTKIFLLHLQ